MDDNIPYWFRRSEQGIGLMWPVTWQGYVIYISYILLVMIPLFIRSFLSFPAGYFKWILVENLLLWTIALILIIRIKGFFPEKPEKSTFYDDDYWFPKKSIGIGWGFPCTWQGLLVFAEVFIGIGLPFLFKDVLGNYYESAIIVNTWFWLIFLIVMVVRHGEK